MFKPASIPMGVRWHADATDPALDRLTPFATSYFNRVRRCTLDSTTGEITGFYGEVSPSTFYDGTDEVMVQFPKMYYKNVLDPSAGSRHMEPMLSETPRPGYKLHPAWVVNSVERPFIYASAFEGSNGAGDKLRSIANAGVLVSQTETVFRTRAQARNADPSSRAADGLGWQLLDYNTLAALQMLFIIDNATLDSQSKFRGRVDTTSACKTGYTSSINVDSAGKNVDTGNGSGESTQGAGLASFAWRGIENFWGNVHNWTDGIKFLSYDVWVADHGFDDTDPSSTPGAYINVSDVGGGVGVMVAGGWFVLTDILYSSAYDYLFLPKSAPASLDYTTYFCDGDYTTHTGLTALFSGGAWDSAAGAGAFLALAHAAASSSYAYVGGRLVFK
jgi:hypothetical protein